MRFRLVRVACSALVATALVGLVAACGGKSSITIPPFFQGVIGPGGGQAAATGCLLVLPSGALATDTAVAILPEPSPLPIDPAAGAGVDYMPGLVCIGPVGLDLLADAFVRICYEPADLPKGTTEADLVLLEWDAAQGFMLVRQAGDPGVTQDLVGHCFEDKSYRQLGHIGVGVRPMKLDFAFRGSDGNFVRPAAVVGGFFNGLILADSTGVNPPSSLGGTQGGGAYIPSRDRTRILYSFEGKGASIETVDVATGDIRTVSGSDSYGTSDPSYGWFETGDRVWLDAIRFDDGFGFDYSVVQDVGGSGTPAASDFYDARDAGGNVPFLDDVRVSPDGKKFLLAYSDDDDGVVIRYDVVDAATGAAIGIDILGGYEPPQTPRWLPDSSALYYIVSPTTVERVSPDGSTAATLYTLTVLGSSLQDFVVSPDFLASSLATSHCAYVRFDPGVAGAVQAEGLVSFIDRSAFVVDRLTGGQAFVTDLGSAFFVRELIYHPNGVTVWADLSPSGRSIGNFGVIAQGNVAVPPFTEAVTVFNATSSAIVRSIVTTMDDLDVSRQGGKVLLWMRSDQQDPTITTAGFYLLGSDGTGEIPVVLPGLFLDGAPRWLSSWRHAPGMSGTAQVR